MSPLFKIPCGLAACDKLNSVARELMVQLAGHNRLKARA